MGKHLMLKKEPNAIVRRSNDSTHVEFYIISALIYCNVAFQYFDIVATGLLTIKISHTICNVPAYDWFL